MKLRKSYIKYSALLAISVITSCKKMVDIDDPINTVTPTKIFNSDAQANQTIAGLYSQMIGIRDLQLTFGAASIYGGLLADELVPSDMVSDPENAAFFLNNLLPGNLPSEAKCWVPTYKIIYTANSILEGEKASNSAQLTPNKRHELRGTAKFMRAFCFFYLTNMYGEVPMPLSSNYTETIQLGRASQAALNEQMVIDLKEAIEDYKSITPELTTKSKSNLYSAEALLARIYLYQKNWTQAEIHSNNVINSGKFVLGALERTFVANSPEAIFQLTVSNDASEHPNEKAYLTPLFPLYLVSQAERDLLLSDVSIYEMSLQYFKPAFYIHDHLVNAFEVDDRRKTVWMNFNPSPSMPPYNGIRTYFSNKYPPTGANSRGYVVIRLAEMHLIRAEALAMQNKLELALEDLNKIRGRAGLGNLSNLNQEATLEAILQERNVELFTEWGHRFFDLKRTGKAISVLSTITEKEDINADKLVLPIPGTEITRNPRLTQNPGY